MNGYEIVHKGSRYEMLAVEAAGDVSGVHTVGPTWEEIIGDPRHAPLVNLLVVEHRLFDAAQPWADVLARLVSALKASSRLVLIAEPESQREVRSLASI